MRRSSVRFNLVFPMLVIASAIAWRLEPRAGASQSVDDQRGPLLEQPADWVAFTADVRVTDPGEPPMSGSFARSQNGSTRLETWFDNQPDARLVSINNVTQARMYVRSLRSGAWMARPMPLRPGGHVPTPWRAGVEGLVPYPYKLALQKNLQVKGDPLQAEAGFTAYRYASGDGDEMIMVPELNFFPVVRRTSDGRDEQYSNIDILSTDLPFSLFEPPPGASVTFDEKPMGVVRPPGAAQ